MNDFLSFRRMITPIIIRVIFWIGFFGSIIGGIAVIVLADETGARVAGILWIILGPLIWRIVCEFLILQFRINETLTEIKNNTQQK